MLLTGAPLAPPARAARRQHHPASQRAASSAAAAQRAAQAPCAFGACAPPRAQPRRAAAARPLRAAAVDLAAWNAASDARRLDALEAALAADLAATAGAFASPVLTWAGLAGDCALLDAVARKGLLPRVHVVFIDTLHLFPETAALLRDSEAQYGFKALRYCAAGCDSKAEWNKRHASDLYMTDPEQYDQLAKVEPLERALRELRADAWINGRRRDQGADRASLPVFEAAPSAGGLVKVNPLAHWTFSDCFAYLARHGAPQHPLHAQGYPSIGDVHSTLPVPREKWFVYGGERSGRFQGLENKDGSAKTECGIHNKLGGGAGAGAAPSSGLQPPAASSSLLRPS